MSGYSGKALGQKLGITSWTRVKTRNAPGELSAAARPTSERRDAVHPAAPAGRSGPHLQHCACAPPAELRRAIEEIEQDGAIWVSWPKKASGVRTDITEDVIREVALPMGLVDVKVCAVDETWSGLKLVIRKANRKANHEDAKTTKITKKELRSVILRALRSLFVPSWLTPATARVRRTARPASSASGTASRPSACRDRAR